VHPFLATAVRRLSAAAIGAATLALAQPALASIGERPQSAPKRPW
jgi:hypothetical protein